MRPRRIGNLYFGKGRGAADQLDFYVYLIWMRGNWDKDQPGTTIGQRRFWFEFSCNLKRGVKWLYNLSTGFPLPGGRFSITSRRS